MYNVICKTFGEATARRFDTIEEAAQFIDTYQELCRGAGQVQGRDYDVEMEVAA